MTIDDYKAVLDIWLRAGLPFKPQGRDSREAIARQLESGAIKILGAKKEGRLIGVVMASHDGRKGWINRLAVDPAHQGQGVASRLIAAAEEGLYRQGLGILAVLIEADNEASLKLFQKAGYRLSDIRYLSKRVSEEV